MLDEKLRAARLTAIRLPRRLLDLDQPTEMDRLERGLASPGVELVVTTRKPAAPVPGDLADAARRTSLG